MEPTGIHMDVEAPLDEVIKHFYCIQTSADSGTIDQHLSPNLEMMLIFNFGKPVRFSFANEHYKHLLIDEVAVIGPLRKMLNYELLPGSDLIIATFHADGFYRLFNLPVDAVAGEEPVINPDVILQTNVFHMLWEMLSRLTSLPEKIELLKASVMAFLKDTAVTLPVLLSAIEYFNNPAVQPVRALAMDAALSERTIQLRFKKYLGYSPKELLRFLRFKRVIGSLLARDHTAVDWFELVETFGYHDQSHLIKDFQHYLGTTPQKFIVEMAGKAFCVSRDGKYYA